MQGGHAGAPNSPDKSRLLQCMAREHSTASAVHAKGWARGAEGGAPAVLGGPKTSVPIGAAIAFHAARARWPYGAEPAPAEPEAEAEFPGPPIKTPSPDFGVKKGNLCAYPPLLPPNGQFIYYLLLLLLLPLAVLLGGTASPEGMCRCRGEVRRGFYSPGVSAGLTPAP